MQASVAHKILFDIGIGLSLIILLIINSCSNKQRMTTMQNSLTKKEISRIATDEIKKKEQWDALKVSFIERRKDDWYVIIVRLPETPGGHRTLLISLDGKVKEYVRGN